MSATRGTGVSNPAGGSVAAVSGAVFVRFMNGLAVWLGAVVAFALGIISLFCSYRVANDRSEIASPAFGLALVGGLVAVVVLTLMVRGAADVPEAAGKRPTRALDLALFLTVTAVGLVWVALMDAPARGDSGTIMAIAEDLAAGRMPSQLAYLERCPHQVGYTLYATLWVRACGPQAVTAIRIVNCLCSGGVAVLLRRFCARIAPGGAPAAASGTSVACAVLLALFLPLPLYADFAYGTIPSLFLALLGIYLLQWPQLRTGGRVNLGITLGRICFGFAALFGSLVLKLNSLVFVAGFVAVCLVRAVALRGGRRRTLQLAMAALALVAYVLAAKVPGAMLQSKLDANLNLGEGTPKLAWVAMGTHESRRGPGWYDGYVRQAYLRHRGNAEAIQADAQADLQRHLEGFAHDPAYATSFYLRKIASEWVEPTFQSIWSTLDFGPGNLRVRRGETPLQRHERGLAVVARARAQHPLVVAAGVYDGPAYLVIYVVLDAFQTVVYALAAVGLWSLRGSRGQRRATRSARLLDTRVLTLAVIFLAGFLFHVVWEAKSQYTFSYFVLLIPYAAHGLTCVRAHGRPVTRP